MEYLVVAKYRNLGDVYAKAITGVTSSHGVLPDTGIRGLSSSDSAGISMFIVGRDTVKWINDKSTTTNVYVQFEHGEYIGAGHY